MAVIRVVVPAPLRDLAGLVGEVDVEVSAPVTWCGVIDALEARYPALRGTIRDQTTRMRRPKIRFFVCGEDWSHQSPDTPLPGPVAVGAEPFLVVAAISGG